MELDSLDRKLLRAVQKNAARTVQDLAEDIGLSATPTARRLRRLSEAGVIDKQVALLDPAALGLNTTLFIFVRTNRHDAQWLEQFSTGVARIPEVVEFYRLGGEIDYLLKVCLPEISDYDTVYKRLISIAPLSNVSASFTMEAIKNTTELPV